MGRFEIHRTCGGNYFFTIVAANGKTMATSEKYGKKKACYVGIKTIRNLVKNDAAILDRSMDHYER